MVESGEVDLGSSGGTASGVMLLPISIAGVYTFLEQGTVLTALTALFGGAEAFALAVTTALWVIGAFAVTVIGAVAFLTFAATVAAILKQSAAHAGLSIAGMLYFVVSIGGAIVLFPELPLLVGFVIVTNVLIFAATIAAFIIGTVYALFMV